MSNSYIGYYNQLALITGIVGIVLLLIAILLWFKLDVKHYFAVLTGQDAKKQIERIRSDASRGNIQGALRSKNNGAVIAWNTSGNLDGRSNVRSGGRNSGRILSRNTGRTYGNTGRTYGNGAPMNAMNMPMNNAVPTGDQTTLIGGGAAMGDQTTLLGAGAPAGDQTTLLGAGNNAGFNNNNAGYNGNNVGAADPYATTVLSTISNMEQAQTANGTTILGNNQNQQAPVQNNPIPVINWNLPQYSNGNGTETSVIGGFVVEREAGTTQFGVNNQYPGNNQFGGNNQFDGNNQNQFDKK